MVTKMADQEQTAEPGPEVEPTEAPAPNPENPENENQNAAAEEQPETAQEASEAAPAETPQETTAEPEAAGGEAEQAPAAEETPQAEEGTPAPAEEQIAEGGEEQAEKPAEGEGAAEGATEAAPEGAPEGASEAAPEGTPTAEGEGEAAAGEAGEEQKEATAEGEGTAEAPKEEGEEGAQQKEGEGDGGEQAAEGAEPAEPAAAGEQAATEGQQPAEGEEGGEQPGEPRSPVPQSDTFADGERAETPVKVGEKLSREGTPTGDEREDSIPPGSGPHSPLVPGTPERVSVIGEEEDDDQEEEHYEEEDEEYDDEPQFDREQLIEKYHQALAERQQLQEQNYQLQHKLGDYFQKKKSEDTRQDMDKNVTDQEQRYLKYMANLDDLRRQDTEEREYFKGQIEDLKDKCQDKQERVNDERFKFMEFKKEIALASVNSRSGKPIPPKDIEQIIAKENNKEAEVVSVRLENIKLKNKLKKKEMMLKSKEELAEGLHLIDFEQLKIENQTYNEKIEERNEELLKLRKKITSTVEVLTHLKEKLQFVQGENGVLKGRLREVEDKAGKKRDILSRTKQARDALRIDNQRLRQNCGLLGNTALLRDFEERKDEGDDLRQKLDNLKMQHAELTLNLNGVRRKIEQAKVGATNV